MSLHILIRNHEALWANVWKFTVESRVVSATEFICNMGRGGLQHGTAVETGKDAFCRTQIKEKNKLVSQSSRSIYTQILNILVPVFTKGSVTQNFNACNMEKLNK